MRGLRGWVPTRRRAWALGTTDVAHARLLADAERVTGDVPAGCAWLDERTVGDLDLPLVFRTIDRTATPSGAQALWRWLVAPAVQLDVLDARERSLARLADPALRERVRDAIGGQPSSDAPHLPRLLWEPLPTPLRTGALAALAATLVLLGVLAVWWPMLVIGCVALLVANVLIDDWVSLRFAPHSRALEVLGQVIGAAERIVARSAWADPAITQDVAACARFRKRLAWLTVRDQLGLADLLRGGFLLRLLMLGRWMRVIERDRDRLRRVVRWVGELDALASIAALRAERADVRVPRLATGPAPITARDLVHPAVTGAIGNDLALDGGLLLTGSNASGKSTFLRAIAINAICAQSIHTTFGSWDAGLVRVFAVMRIADVTAEGTSTYAVEVAAIGALVDAVRDGELPALFAIDEPFRGTNPALRVPIVVSVLDYLGARDVAIAATHDLDVAAQVGRRFARGYFSEPDDTTGQFDRKLRPGIAPTSNALA
ncbi:MAG: hypothetical protein ABIY55_20790, partial [Kofleriaceae bacterium]